MSQTKRNGAVAAIIPAGGVGQRFGHEHPKQFLRLAGWPVLAHTLSRFEQSLEVEDIVVVAPAGFEESVQKEVVERFSFTKVRRVVTGGQTRQESVYNGFLFLEDLEFDLVLIHDGVRPLVPPGVIEAVIAQARLAGAAIAAVKTRDTLKKVEHGVIVSTVDRELVWQAQTPQVFDRHWLAEALAIAKKNGFSGTDEAGLLEAMGKSVFVVPGSADNIKITHPEDLALAESLISYGEEEEGMRIGMGYDVHQIAPGRDLVLGGKKLDFGGKGLLGHSDADVLTHALIDALFGAAGLPDIGSHYPDTDPAYSGAKSLDLLTDAMARVRAAGFELVNADITLLAQRPKIAPHAQAMRRALALAASCEAERLNIKATTTEGLGFTGREEGMAALSVVLLTKRRA